MALALSRCFRRGEFAAFIVMSREPGPADQFDVAGFREIREGVYIEPGDRLECLLLQPFTQCLCNGRLS